MVHSYNGILFGNHQVRAKEFFRAGKTKITTLGGKDQNASLCIEY